MTGLVRDLYRALDGDVAIGVGTSAMDLWQHNPYVSRDITKVSSRVGVTSINLDYGPGIREHKSETIHFLTYWHRVFERATKIHVPVTEPKPDLHLGPNEQLPMVSGRYWVVVAGGKSDYPIKVWHKDHYQAVTDGLRSMGLGVVQVGSNDRGHWHIPLAGALDLVGQTNLRDLMRLIAGADGVICGITCAMHMAAALQRPCVVVAGGREAWWWEGYVRENRGLVCPELLRMPHRYLHTIGQLECCRAVGCWKNKLVPSGKDRSICTDQFTLGAQTIPRCLEMITPTHVLAAVQSYYTDNSLPPIGSVPQLALPPATAAAPALLVQPVGRGRGHVPAATAPNVIAPPQPGAARRPPLPPVKVGRTTKEVRKHVERTHHPADAGVFDNPLIGGKFTIFVLLYGDFPTMHRECLQSILATVPPERRDLRIGSNQLCEKTRRWVEELVVSGQVKKHYAHADNARKYPVMREMFHDPDCPITTQYLIWFDDDSICSHDASWLSRLAREIIEHHPKNARMFGPRKFFTITSALASWIKTARWYKHLPFQDKFGKVVPNGTRIHFAVGAFWALHTQTMRDCDIPDTRIGHNWGDIAVGAQIRQGGCEVRSFSAAKDVVKWSAYSRRGLTEADPLGLKKR